MNMIHFCGGEYFISWVVSSYEPVNEIFVVGEFDNIQAYCMSVLISNPV
jgi:hypothetical protein